MKHEWVALYFKMSKIQMSSLSIILAPLEVAWTAAFLTRPVSGFEPLIGFRKSWECVCGLGHSWGFFKCASGPRVCILHVLPVDATAVMVQNARPSFLVTQDHPRKCEAESGCLTCEPSEWGHLGTRSATWRTSAPLEGRTWFLLLGNTSYPGDSRLFDKTLLT